MEPTKHKHHDMIVAWAADTSRVVQYRHSGMPKGVWSTVNTITWEKDIEYRFKPEPKPDTFVLAHVVKAGNQLDGWDFRSNHLPNIKFIFDGETGQLKDSEVLK